MTQRAIKLPTCKCERCGYEWVPSVPRPKVCPSCKSYKWDIRREPKGQTVVEPEAKTA